MSSWDEFTKAAPRISSIFARRHAATGNLCMLATTRSDGYPRISPMEPRMFEGELLVVGMPETTKFKDLHRDPRFCLHTATVDTQVGDGDAKLFGLVRNLQDEAMHERFAEALFNDIGFDLRGRKLDPFYVADITGASAVEIGDGCMEVVIWKAGEAERVVEKRP